MAAQNSLLHALSTVLAAVGRTARRPPRWLVLTLLVLAVEASYVFIISAGKWVDWPTWFAYYDSLAEGFRAGHLYLPLEPQPGLLLAQDPWDRVNEMYWRDGRWDLSYANGHFYLYWGPVPALALAAIKTVFRVTAQIGDQYPVFAFDTIQLIAGALLIDRMARRLFERIPLALVAFSILVFAYANPTPFMLATPGIYHAAISGARAFLVLGLLFLFDAVWRRSAGNSARVLFVLTGACWGLALGCRGSSGPTAALITLSALLLALPGSSRSAWLERARTGLLIAAPFAACAAALLAYNKARFDAWLDFGLGRQLTTMHYRTAPEYVIPNLFAYLVRPFQVSCEFPFLSPPPTERGFPSWLTIPEGYWTPEPLVGTLVAMPWSWLIPVAAFFAARSAWRLWKARRDLGGTELRSRIAVWCALAFALLGTVTALATVAEFFATMRFVADISAGITLLAIWGAWSLYAAVKDQPWRRRAVVAGIVGLGGVTIVFGLLLGLQGYDNIFERCNPALFQHWVKLFSRC